MKSISLNKIQVDTKALYKRGALETDATLRVTDDCIINLEGSSPLVLLTLEGCAFTAKELSKIKWNNTKRMSWLSTSAKIFGYQGRIGLRENYCHQASLNKENPALTKKLYEEAKKATDLMWSILPEYYLKQSEEIQKVLLDWRIEDSFFTSGIINNKNALNYHFDSGNFEGCMSAMVVLQHGTSWGNLVLPEYDAKLDFGEKPRLVIFDGQKTLHGVTPINYLTPDAHRYSVVYYSLKSLWKCLPPDEELKFARKHRVQAERKKAALVKAKIWK